MTKNSTIGFTNGILVELKRQDKPITESIFPEKGSLNDVISVVLEKTARPCSLKNCEYDSFTLRRKLFHHQCSYVVTVYAPLMAVNLTKNIISIFDKPFNGESRTKVTLYPSTNAYINLHKNVKKKLFLQTPDYCAS